MAEKDPYANMTDADFDRIMLDLMKKMPMETIFHTPGVYEIFSEELNNAVLTKWEEEQGQSLAEKGSLSSEQMKKYLMDNGRHCPYCESDDLTATTATQMPEEAFYSADVTCGKCKRQWTDLYKLIHIEEKLK